MLSLFGFIITISILVFIHEFGHYYVAKLFGMKIEVFSIGFGKEIFSKIDKNGMKWKICSLPLGGYVKIYGFDSTAPRSQVVNSEAKSFRNKPLYAQFLTILAGPAANYLLAIFIFANIYYFHGKVIIPPIIGEIVAYSPAEKAGLRENDRIIRIDSNNINDFTELQQNIWTNDKTPLKLTIIRGEEIINISLLPEIVSRQIDENRTVEIPYVGITAKNMPVVNKLNIFQSLYQASRKVINISSLILKTIGQMVIGTRGLEFAGPITIAKESGKSLNYGITSFVAFMAMISINLGLLNLFPIPIFDGGHLIFIIYEGIFGKAVNQTIKNVILKVGMLITIFLIVISISNDIKNLIF